MDVQRIIAENYKVCRGAYSSGACIHISSSDNKLNQKVTYVCSIDFFDDTDPFEDENIFSVKFNVEYDKLWDYAQVKRNSLYVITHKDTHVSIGFTRALDYVKDFVNKLNMEFTHNE